MAPWLIAVLGLLGTALTVLGTIAVSRRQRSGRISTTEAAVLWEESSSIRQELRQELADERKARQVLEKEVALLRERTGEQEAEIKALRLENEDSHRQIHLLQARIDNLTNDVTGPVEAADTKAKRVGAKPDAPKADTSRRDRR